MPSSAEVKWLLLMQLSRKKMKGVRRGVEESHARSPAKLFFGTRFGAILGCMVERAHPFGSLPLTGRFPAGKAEVQGTEDF